MAAAPGAAAARPAPFLDLFLPKATTLEEYFPNWVGAPAVDDGGGDGASGVDGGGGDGGDDGSLGLYLGSASDASNAAGLQALGVTHVLMVLLGHMPAHPDKFKYKVVPALDWDSQDLRGFFGECFTFIDEALAGPPRVEGARTGCALVACGVGISRSSTIVLAYLMWRCGIELFGHGNKAAGAWERVVRARPGIEPNPGFLSQLREFDLDLRLARWRASRRSDHVPSMPEVPLGPVMRRWPPSSEFDAAWFRVAPLVALLRRVIELEAQRLTGDDDAERRATPLLDRVMAQLREKLAEWAPGDSRGQRGVVMTALPEAMHRACMPGHDDDDDDDDDNDDDKVRGEDAEGGSGGDSDGCGTPATGWPVFSGTGKIRVRCSRSLQNEEAQLPSQESAHKHYWYVSVEEEDRVSGVQLMARVLDRLERLVGGLDGVLEAHCATSAWESHLSAAVLPPPADIGTHISLGETIVVDAPDDGNDAAAHAVASRGRPPACFPEREAGAAGAGTTGTVLLPKPIPMKPGFVEGQDVFFEMDRLALHPWGDSGPADPDLDFMAVSKNDTAEEEDAAATAASSVVSGPRRVRGTDVSPQDPALRPLRWYTITVRHLDNVVLDLAPGHKPHITLGVLALRSKASVE